MEFLPGKLGYSMRFSLSGKHSTLQFTCFPCSHGRENRETSGFPGWKFEETPLKPQVFSKKHEVKHWETTGFQKITVETRGFLKKTIGETTWKIKRIAKFSSMWQVDIIVWKDNFRYVRLPCQKVTRLVIVLFGFLFDMVISLTLKIQSLSVLWSSCENLFENDSWWKMYLFFNVSPKHQFKSMHGNEGVIGTP